MSTPTAATPADLLEPGEISFGFEELFFSRTDAGGIIQAGNDVFQRVAQYDWAELLQKPHKIIRHPDMPRAVFWLLWDTIKRGAPIGAYVKNRAKDGRLYWVFAVVTPVEGGYLSVRLRPSSALLPIVKREYAALVAAERAGGLRPEESAGRLLARLKELGFADYPTFMAAALGKEIAARDARLAKRPARAVALFDKLLETSGALLTKADLIAEAYQANANVPFNFRVLAAQLGQDGSAIGVISTNYTLLSNEMKTILADFIEGGLKVRGAIDQGYFLAMTARLQREVVAFFEAEREDPARPRANEMALLAAQQAEYTAKAAAGLEQIAKTVLGFQRDCVDMTRLVAGLEVTRIMGKVECARHASVKDRLDELLGDLERFQRSVAAALKEIEAMNSFISAGADELIQSAA